MQYSVYLLREYSHVTISPDGTLRSVSTTGKSWGPGDVDKAGERTEIRQGKLTPEQMAKLVQMFSDWERLSDRYPAKPDEPEAEVRYGTKTVSSGFDDMPTQMRAAYEAIREIAQTMPIVKP